MYIGKHLNNFVDEKDLIDYDQVNKYLMENSFGCNKEVVKSRFSK